MAHVKSSLLHQVNTSVKTTITIETEGRGKQRKKTSSSENCENKIMEGHGGRYAQLQGVSQSYR